MKNLIAALVVCVALATTSFDADAAKRFGGGASFGKAAPTSELIATSSRFSNSAASDSCSGGAFSTA